MARALFISVVFWLALVMPATAGPLAGLIAAIPAIAALGSTAASLIGWGVTAALAIGASLLLAPKAQTPTPSDVSGVVKQDVPARWVHRGRRRVGGALLFAEVKAGNLHLLIANQHGRCEAFERTLLDGHEVVLDGLGLVTGIVGSGENPYPLYTIQVVTRPGTDDQTAVGELTGTFPELWTSDHRVRGTALTYIWQGYVDPENFSKVYPNRIIQVEQIGRFGQAYDPRDATTAWTQNIALLLGDYLTSADGMQIASGYINMPRLAAAADLCDEEVPIKGGSTIPRYNGGLSYSMDADPASIISRYLTAMDGRLTLLADGTVGIDAGAFSEPTVIFDDSCIIGYELRAGGDPASEANDIRAQFTFAGADYVAADADPWRDEADIAASGEAKTATLSLFEVEHHNHARRLMKLAAARALPAYQGSITTNLKGLEAWDQRFVRIRGTLYSLDHTFEVLNIALDPATMTVTLQVVSLAAAAYAFDAETEEGTAPTIPDDDDAATIGPPEGLTVTRSYRTVSSGVRAPVLEVAWDAPLRAYSTAQAQISVHGAGAWRDITLVRDANPPQAGLAESVSDGTEYDVRVRWRAPDTDWSTISTETAIGDPDAPDAPTAVAATPVGGGSVDILWLAPVSARYAGARIYGNDVDDFATADLLSDLPGAPSPNLQSHRLTGLAADTWYFWVTAVNGSGVESAEAGSGATTIT
ncbi:hypothetical protein SAMN02745157_1536 [Kaistia soli DSM 19436]|uniref:Fibronectin type-III domain-containing protein n=1 Tax=Kaistia soli DSM 19436 TaxID=1122133 RepID=A0A1M4YJF9_9HYPH|nr:fibronectin type III domain-containing protein [Kaistia soli]SHF05788.1 hypothetical protein SAMN02745157_1536 [Kaistia soli DSM 19436]